MEKSPKVLVYVYYFLALIVGYILFGLGSMAMSDEDVERHVRQTVDQSDLKADFWFAFLYKPNYYMDNFTDALVLNQAWCLGEAGDTLNAWQRLMLVPRHRCMVDGVEQSCESLRRLTEGDTTLRTTYYPRYWHGSTFLMRYLLAVDDYVVMRGLFFLFSSLLLLWLLLGLARKVGARTSVLYLLAFVLVDGFMMQFSIQFLPVLMITLAGSLVALHRKDSCLGITFFVLGSLTAYFDLLTAPLLTWGLPLLVALQVPHRKIAPTVGASLLWPVSYVATWATKWLLATLTTPMNVFTDAAAQASLRAAVEDYTRWGAVERNLDLVPWLIVTIVAGMLMALIIHYFKGKGWRRALACLAVATTPVVWYMLLGNHSYEHYWFTYRSLAITVLGIFFAIASMIEWKEI